MSSSQIFHLSPIFPELVHHAKVNWRLIFFIGLFSRLRLKIVMVLCEVIRNCQDWFTEVSWRAPHLVHILDCKWNRQVSMMSAMTMTFGWRLNDIWITFGWQQRLDDVWMTFGWEFGTTLLLVMTMVMLRCQFNTFARPGHQNSLFIINAEHRQR